MNKGTLNALLDELEKLSKAGSFKFVRGLVKAPKGGPASRLHATGEEAFGVGQLRQMAKGRSIPQPVRAKQAVEPERLAKQVEKAHPLSEKASVVEGGKLSRRTADVMKREAQLEKLVAEGKFTKAHDIPHFVRTGEIRVRPGTAASRAATTAETYVRGAPPASGTGVFQGPLPAPPPAATPAPAAAEAVAPGRIARIRERFSKMSPRAQLALGSGALGLTGFGGGLAVD